MNPRDPFEELNNISDFTLSDEALVAHKASIDSALDARKVVPLRRRIPLMRWVAATVILLGIGAPSAVIASTSSIPGDLLYPIKQISEPILVRFDPEVVARHRIDEVVKLRERDLPSDRVLREAEEAVDRLPSDSPLRDELADLDNKNRQTDSTPATRPPVTTDTQVRPTPISTQPTQPSNTPTTATPRTTTTTARPDRTTTTSPESDR